MGDQRDAGRPKARIVLSAGDAGAQLRCEFAMHRGDVNADLFKDAAVHHRHDAAAAIAATILVAVAGSLVAARPGRALKAAGRQIGMRKAGRQLVLKRLEGGADIVAQACKPGAGGGLLGGDVGRHRHGRKVRLIEMHVFAHVRR